MPVSIPTACPVTGEDHYLLHVQVQTSVATNQTTFTLTEFYKIYEKVMYNGVSSSFNLNVTGEQVSFQKSVCVGREGEAKPDPFQL